MKENFNLMPSRRDLLTGAGVLGGLAFLAACSGNKQPTTTPTESAPATTSATEADYVRLKDTYILDNKKMKTAKDDMIILHPLPRVNEIATEVDENPRAKYFNQVKFGMIIRMALILKLLEVK